ncbi:MAG: DnaJ domain-containing protein [Candidatus Competibacterales bacterium]|nr:DnaJ domain-containing protein [Candidatus Competibacterales bacterium]
MPLTVLLGIVLIGFGIYGFNRWSQQVGPARTREVVRKTALGVLAAAAVLLLIRSGSALLALAVAALPFARRLLPLVDLVGRSGVFQRTPGGRADSSTGATGNQTSSVATRYLDMTLDHGTGALNGKVRTGQFAGRALDTMGLDELRALLDECHDDPQSVAVLETYLDRTHEGWRESGARHESTGNGRSVDRGMDRREACEILGVTENASREEIIAAHRRLMQRLHPDHGGSDYLASRINEAKKVLLD